MYNVCRYLPITLVAKLSFAPILSVRIYKINDTNVRQSTLSRGHPSRDSQFLFHDVKVRPDAICKMANFLANSGSRVLVTSFDTSEAKPGQASLVHVGVDISTRLHSSDFIHACLARS